MVINRNVFKWRLKISFVSELVCSDFRNSLTFSIRLSVFFLIRTQLRLELLAFFFAEIREFQCARFFRQCPQTLLLPLFMVGRQQRLCASQGILPGRHMLNAVEHPEKPGLIRW